MLGLALTFVVGGCKKKPQGVTQLPPGRVQPNNSDLGNAPGFNPHAADTSSTPGNIAFTGTGNEHLGWPENPEILKAETVYFEFDKSSIKSSEQAKLESVANYLKSNPSHAVRVEGNCDERGTEEYNRSLGERRALSAREHLVQLGIDPTRVDTVTYGEDKPAVSGHDEGAYAKNRRDDFVVLTPKQ
ncbi:MAG: Minor outer membrane protein Omp16 [Pedosphaera sp.]|nr:Minor outer membrane protein Omp16 [Pedosphaera sp.]